MNWSLLLAAVAFLVTAAPTLTYFRTHLVMVDDQDRSRIEIRFENKTHQALCISTGDWPNVRGSLHFQHKRVALVIGKKRFPIAKHNGGYCYANDCEIKVSPGKTIVGYIPYSEFNLPKEMWHRRKKLVYPLLAAECDQTKELGSDTNSRQSIMSPD
jgi:hypothetical protein